MRTESEIKQIYAEGLEDGLAGRNSRYWSFGDEWSRDAYQRGLREGRTRYEEEGELVTDPAEAEQIKARLQRDACESGETEFEASR